MNLKKIMLLLIILQTSIVYCQFKGNSYQFPDRFNQKYFFDPGKEFLKLDSFKAEPNKQAKFDLFKINTTYNFQRNFDNNSIYLDWPDLEKYLNAVIDTILPIDLKAVIKYKVYIKRNSTVFCENSKFGTLFITMGLINECENETELAYIMARSIGQVFYDKELIYNSEELTTDFMSMFTSNPYVNELNYYNESAQSVSTNNFQADSFAIECLKKGNLNVNTINPEHYIQYVSDTHISYIKKLGSRPYNSSKSKYLSDFAANNLKKTPYIKRTNYSNLIKLYSIDSVYFSKLKKISSDECTKINFESGNFKGVIYSSFKKYLLGDNSAKNLYYIFESIRRYLYANPDLSTKGFLAEDLKYTEFESKTHSVLLKPQVLFHDSLSYIKVSGHSLIKDKPFNNYEDAYLYFVSLAETKGFNESIFSQALFHYYKNDDINFKNKLNQYLEKGGGLFSEFASNLQQFGFPYIKDGKTNILIDNTTNYYKDNYFHSLQRLAKNNLIYEIFQKDTSKIKLIILSQFLGVAPKKQYEYEKLIWNISQLYKDTDKEIFHKKNYNAKETIDDKTLRNKFNKNLLIYIPEWYAWFKDNNFSGILFQKIKYEYSNIIIPEEYTNSYELEYINFFDNRPFFGNSIRNGNTRKQKTVDMVSDAKNYLFYKE